MNQRNKLKVVLINDYAVGGGAEQVFSNHEKIIQDAFEVKTFIGSGEKVDPGVLQHFFSVRYFCKILKLLRKEQPDVIHLHNFHNYLSPSILLAFRVFKFSSKKKPKVIYSAHDYHLLWPDSLYGYYERGKFKKLEFPITDKRLLHCSLSNRSKLVSIYKKVRWVFNYKLLSLANEIDVLVAPSQFLLEKLKEAFPRKLSLIIRNPTYHNVNRPSEKMKTGEKRALKAVKLVFLGRLSIEKGLIEFIELLFKEKIRSFELSIYGDGPIKNAIKAKIEEFDFQDQIILKGKAKYNEINKELAFYDALVLPSICYENAPLVLVEGALSNLKLLTCDYGGMKEIGDLCGGAYYFNYTDPGTLGKAIDEMTHQMNNTECRIDAVSKIFSFETHRNSLLNLYNSLCSV